MDEEIQQPEHEPKISDVEIILVGVFFGVLDLIDLIPIAGDITDVVAAPMGFYYWMKGINATTFIVAEVLDLIPGVQEIPSRTIGWGITVWLDRHPKIEGKLGAAIAIAGALEGDVTEGAAAEAGAAEAEAGKAAATGGATRAAGAPHADGVANPEGAAGEGNTRPSEKSTEHGTEAQEEAKRWKSEGRVTEGGGSSEEQRKEAENERYREIVEPEGAKDPIERAKKEDFAEKKPFPQNAANRDEEPSEPAKSTPKKNEPKSSLDERFPDFKKRIQEAQGHTGPQVIEEGDSDNNRAQAA